MFSAWALAVPAQEIEIVPKSRILEDDLSIRIKNTKPQFISIFFERRQVIHIATQEDLLEYTRFSLPETLDPPYDNSFVPWHDRDARPVPKWLNTRIDQFSAHIIHADGSKGELAVMASVQHEGLRTLRTMQQATSFIHEIQGLQVGDVLEVHWKYMIPYDANLPASAGWRSFEWMDNWARLTSWRIFFHAALPIEKQRIELKYDLRHGLKLGGAAPDHRTENGNEVICVWEQAHLPGCMNEPNARPAMDLPHITVLFAPEDHRYWRRDRLSGLPFPQPYWLHVVRFREARAFWLWRVSRKRLPDRQNQLVKEFIQRNSAHFPDSLRVDRMRALHNKIALDFTYENDVLWYRNKDEGLQKIGDQLNDQRIRDISRYDMYAKLVNGLGLGYSTAYVMDKRVGHMNDLYLSPLWDSEFLVGVRDGHGMTWMHPKRSDYGLLANELPFYWQGIDALLVDMNLLMEDIPRPPLFVELPVVINVENVRGKEFSLDVDLAERTASARIRVFLSGQFSTLGRGAYLGLPIDSTVDPLYGHRAFDISMAEKIEWKNEKVDEERPYRFRANGQVRLDKGMIGGENGTFTIDLTDLFMNVLPDPFDPNERQLPFHWDFPMVDHHSVEIRFDRAVEILNAEDLNIDIATSNSSFSQRVRSTTSSNVVVETRLQVDREREDPGEMKQLALLIQQAQENIILEVKEPLQKGDAIDLEGHLEY